MNIEVYKYIDSPNPNPKDDYYKRVEFIENMEDLVAFAYSHTAKFPKRFGANYTNRLITYFIMAQEALKLANDTKINYKYWKYGKTDATYELTQKRYQERTDLFEKCLSYLKLAAGLIKTGKKMQIQELIENDDQVARDFLARIVRETVLVKGVIKSDAREFKRFSIAFGRDFATC